MDCICITELNTAICKYKEENILNLGRGELFSEMSVMNNLLLGCMYMPRALNKSELLSEVFSLSHIA